MASFVYVDFGFVIGYFSKKGPALPRKDPGQKAFSYKLKAGGMKLNARFDN